MPSLLVSCLKTIAAAAEVSLFIGILAFLQRHVCVIIFTSVHRGRLQKKSKRYAYLQC